MRQTTLEILCCPFCQASLSLKTKLGGETVSDGDLICSGCERSYAIRKGIVHFIAPQELAGLNQRFERTYNRLAPFYSIFTKLAFLPFGGERQARMEILEHLGLDGGRTLEISIGNGVNLTYLLESPQAGEIYGLDISIGQLSQCRNLINKRGWQVELFLAMAEQLPFKPETFDRILHIGGINFFSDRKQAITEMIRVVRPGGKVVIADESERLSKLIAGSAAAAPASQGNRPFEETIYKLVPETMQAIRMEGIWKAHGKYHGYCLEFTKPG